MVTRATAAFLSTSLFVVVLALLAGTSEGQASGRYSTSRYHASPRFFSFFSPTTSLWSRARSIMPRFFDVAAEAATALALPALAVLAVSAVWPEHKHYRSKRDAADGSETPIDELSEHMMNIYYAAMESDECIQRIVCELGATARSFKSENLTSMISLLSGTVPTKFNKLFEKFKSGMNLEKCEKLGCSILDK